MTKKQIELVRKSFAMVVPVSDEAGVLFYAKLFDLDPKLRPLFHVGIGEQSRKLMQMLGLAVESLDEPDRLVSTLRALGARHRSYGVEDRHYETVGKALLWTFERALGDDFTPKTKEAWTSVFKLLAGAMKEGARQAPPPPIRTSMSTLLIY